MSAKQTYRRTVRMCWPEDEVSRPPKGGGRTPKAYAYTAEGIAARTGWSRRWVRQFLGERMRDPFTVVAAIIVARARPGRRVTWAQIDQVRAGLETAHERMREREAAATKPKRRRG